MSEPPSWRAVRQMPIALAVNAVNAAITAVVLQRLGAGMTPLLWLAAVLLVAAGRWVLWREYRRQEGRRRPTLGFVATCGSLLAGMCWGVGGALLFPRCRSPGRSF